MKKYSEKLRDPRWQKKRLQILERDNWQCQICKDTESTLHVHHWYYETGKDPWDYPLKSLATLCESCHEDVESCNRGLRESLLDGLNRYGVWPFATVDLANAFAVAANPPYPVTPTFVVGAMTFALKNEEVLMQLCRAYSKHLKEKQKETGVTDETAENDG